MSDEYVISADGACSGKRAACAAVLSVNGRIIAESSHALPEVDGYVLAAEIAGVALASELVGDEEAPLKLTIELDNPDVPRVIEGSYQPKQFSRIPEAVLKPAIGLWSTHNARFCVLSRNSTAGMRRADRLAAQRLWRRL